jgi:DNA-binding NtrC family response regulator
MNAEPPLVYVIDDDASMRDTLSDLLRSVGLRVQTFGSAQEFLRHQQPEEPSCLLLDVQLPGLSGLELQEELARRGSPLPIIFLTGHGDIPMTVRAMKAGAIEFLTKPFRDEDLLQAIDQALQRSGKREPLEPRPAAIVDARAAAAGDGLPPGFAGLVGRSAALRRVLQEVETVAPSDATVLILGETGTGKELVARAVHQASRRASRPFVKLNCAAIPAGLLESELFGHEKGAFTGAIGPKVGRLELADGGTLFLDEVGDIPLELQPKLLRALQEREFERVGSTKTKQVDVRLVAATNRDLSQMIAARQFRTDLYYRLNVFPIKVPPLRERPEDIPVLAQHFTQKFAHRMGKQIEAIPPGVLEGLMARPWPGNVRELENCIERAVILTRGRVLEAAGTCSESAETIFFEAEERARIVRMLRATKGQVGGPQGAAAALGLKRTTLISRMKKLGINPKGLKCGYTSDWRPGLVDR